MFNANLCTANCLTHVTQSHSGLFEAIHEFADKCEKPVRAWFGPFLVVLLTDPDDIQIVLKHENSMQKPFVYKVFPREWVGDGIITADTHVWKSHRRVIASTFNRKILESYMQIFVRQANVFVEQLATFSGTNEAFDVFNYTSRCTLDIICGERLFCTLSSCETISVPFAETTMGIDISSQRGDEYGDLYIKSTRRAFEIMITRVMRLWYTFEPLYRVSSLYRDFLQCTRVLHRLTDKVIEEKRDAPRVARGEARSFVDELFRQASVDSVKWTNKEIRDEISSMIAAGGDTTSHSLAFTILLLAMHPEVQAKAYREIQGVPDEEGSVDCSKLSYLGQVISESLRLFTPTTIIGRYTTGDVRIKTRNLVIPENVFLVIGMSPLHRDKAFWGEEAEKFNPDNFSKENIAKSHPNRFVAFSAGPKNCAGIKFANLSMKVVLCKLLRSYRLETDEKFGEIKCEFGLLLDKVGGWNVRIYPREG